MTDSRKLGIPGMIRQSGDTAGTPGCTLVGPCGSVELDHGVIVAKRHIHMTPVQAYQLNVKDNDSVFVITQRDVYKRQASNCSGNVVPSARCPRATTTRFFIV